MKKYDLLIIGSGPGGEKAAIQGSKLGKKVAVIERDPYIGGAGLHTGTLPSKALRETALYLAGLRQRAVFGFQFVPGRELTLSELMLKKSEIIRRQMEVIVSQFNRNNIEILYGEGSLVDEHIVSVKGRDGASEEFYGEVIVIAAGSRPTRPEAVPFDKEHIYDSDTILKIDRIPATLTIIGGGVIGCEYASIFSVLGVKVNLIEKKPRVLSFADGEITESLMYWMRHAGVSLRLNEEVVDITVESTGRVVTRLKSGKIALSEKLLYTMGRTGNSDGLNLEALGIKTGSRGKIIVNDSYQTDVPNIYAVGDVIGFPSLAATSREQGRRAVCHAFQCESLTCEIAGHMPFGIYTIPEISMVGSTEEELSAERVPYEVGSAYFEEVARGQIIGDVHGMIKLIFNRDDRKLLGVHIVGENASELIHIGQAVMNFGGAVDYFKDVVFNYPTLSDGYKAAALNGLNKL
ncbi:MAG: Si-specific NAD(P)(+) transhydrogenase [Thermodesulfobacteriota bacterium]|nr:MAG: Si-specific NAD(P)(+) transhydrogenase [Thermodesulfobacteriota bacterium]